MIDVVVLCWIIKECTKGTLHIAYIRTIVNNNIKALFT
jgi:hypothetical protein